MTPRCRSEIERLLTQIPGMCDSSPRVHIDPLMAPTVHNQSITATTLRRLTSFSMILKTPTSPMETTNLHLSVVDQRTPRVYTYVTFERHVTFSGNLLTLTCRQTLLIFPFSDGNQAETAIVALTTGLQDTLKKFPFIAGTLSLSHDGSGKLILAYPNKIPDVNESALFNSKIISPDEFKYTYEELKAMGMPPHVFTPELFRPVDLLNYAGVPSNGEGMCDFERSSAPVFRSQASFIPGGLVLFMCFHHTVMDCSGISNFWTYLANEISSGRHVVKGANPAVSGKSYSLSTPHLLTAQLSTCRRISRTCGVSSTDRRQARQQTSALWQTVTRGTPTSTTRHSPTMPPLRRNTWSSRRPKSATTASASSITLTEMPRLLSATSWPRYFGYM
jgi:hypothetical protein